MIRIIQCNWCGKEGWHRVEFTYTYKGDVCKECHHNKSSNWKFWFCDQECFFRWLENQEIEEKGIICQDCHGTGFAFGFENNGTCETCNGTKRVKRAVA